MKLVWTAIFTAAPYLVRTAVESRSRRDDGLPNPTDTPTDILGNTNVWDAYFGVLEEDHTSGSDNLSDNEYSTNVQWVTAMQHRFAQMIARGDSINNAQSWANQLMAKVLGMTLDELANLTGMDRIICTNGPCELPLLLVPLYNYGCWCNLGPNVGKGHGNPVDLYDDACKRQALCARCAEMDSPGCDAGTTEIEATFTWDPSTFSLVANCDVNPDDCSKAVCTCYMAWLSETMNIGFNGNAVDNEQAHSHPNFDHDVTCPRNGGLVTEYECCGLFPLRYPYNIDTAACCEDDGQSYNPDLQDCCENIGVQDIGNCV